MSEAEMRRVVWRAFHSDEIERHRPSRCPLTLNQGFKICLSSSLIHGRAEFDRQALRALRLFISTRTPSPC